MTPSIPLYKFQDICGTIRRAELIEMSRQTFLERLREEPWVAVGCVGTVAVLIGGLKSFNDGNSKRGQNFMRARVFAQATTVFMLAAGGAYSNYFRKEQSYEERKGIKLNEENNKKM